jgi:hypothetical protein
MSAKDRFHEAVKKGLQKEQWVITVMKAESPQG